VILKDSLYLYDLKKEINEKNNLIDNEKTLLEEMGKARVRWEKGMIAPVFLGLNQREEYEKLKGASIKN